MQGRVFVLPKHNLFSCFIKVCKYLNIVCSPTLEETHLPIDESIDVWIYRSMESKRRVVGVLGKQNKFHENILNFWQKKKCVLYLSSLVDSSIDGAWRFQIKLMCLNAYPCIKVGSFFTNTCNQIQYTLTSFILIIRYMYYTHADRGFNSVVVVFIIDRVYLAGRQASLMKSYF